MLAFLTDCYNANAGEDGTHRDELEELYFCEDKNAAPLHRPTFEQKLSTTRMHHSRFRFGNKVTYPGNCASFFASLYATHDGSS
jgi:hypothetical protein